MTQQTDQARSSRHIDYTYSSAGQVSNMNDWAGQNTSYTYTATGAVSTVTGPGSKTWDFDYNALGQAITMTLPNGMAEVYAYDSDHRLTKKDLKVTAGGAVETSLELAYDDSGNITSKTESDTDYWDYGYDARYRLTAATRRFSNGTLVASYTYGYDDADNLISKTEPFVDDFDDDNYSGWSASGTVAVTSNKLVVTGGASSTAYAYKANTAEDGEIVFRCYRPSASTGWSIVYLRHDLSAKWLRIISNGSQMVLQQLDGTTSNLDVNASAGMAADTWYTIRVRMHGTDVTVERAKGGEGLEEVLSTTGADDTLATGRVYFGSDANQVYYYDDIQLMLGGASTASTFAYNSANELSTMTKCNVASTYTYDAWGRTISLARDGQGAIYTYGYGDKLTSVDADWEVPVAYDYNGLGQRVSREVDSTYTTDYYWNGWSVVNEYYDDGTSAGWSKTYVAGLAERAYSGGAYTYYFTDHLGSTEALYDESKDRVGGIGYTPYGTPAFAEGTADGVTHRYTGHDWDALTGQYFAPYRYYAPNMHRWLTRDPMGMVDGPNVYGYVSGNPTKYLDPFGLDANPPWWKGGSGWLTIGKNCDPEKLKEFRYAPEGGTGKKAPQDPLPGPGETVPADAVYMPSGAVKINNLGDCTLRCDKTGAPSQLDCDTGTEECDAYFLPNPVGPDTLPPEQSWWSPHWGSNYYPYPQE